MIVLMGVSHRHSKLVKSLTLTNIANTKASQLSHLLRIERKAEGNTMKFTINVNR